MNGSTGFPLIGVHRALAPLIGAHDHLGSVLQQQFVEQSRDVVAPLGELDLRPCHRDARGPLLGGRLLWRRSFAQWTRARASFDTTVERGRGSKAGWSLDRANIVFL